MLHCWYSFFQKIDEAMYNMLFVVMDPRWKHPFTCVIAGPTGSGKLFG